MKTRFEDGYCFDDDPLEALLRSEKRPPLPPSEEERRLTKEELAEWRAIEDAHFQQFDQLFGCYRDTSDPEAQARHAEILADPLKMDSAQKAFHDAWLKKKAEWFQEKNEQKDNALRDHYVRTRRLIDPTFDPTETKSALPEIRVSKSNGALLSAVIQEFVDEKVATGAWREKSKQENEAIFTLLTRIVSDIPFCEIGYDEIRMYKSVLLKLPANLNKNPEFRDKEIKEVIAIQPTPMNVGTASKHLSRVSSLFDWAVRHGHSKANYAAGIKVTRKKDTTDLRDPFNAADLQKLFCSENYRLGKHRKPWMFWLPLLAAFSGARLNELCQLHLVDFQVVDGIPVISINDDTDDKRLKNKSSKRIIPIHRTLIELGLLNFVEDLRAKRVHRLFSDLRLGRDGYQAQPSKWFSKYKERCAVKIGKDEKKDFHSFRHTVADNLKQKLVPVDQAGAVLGHKNGDDITYGTYGSPYQVKITKGIVDKISYEIDLSHLFRKELNPYLS